MKAFKKLGTDLKDFYLLNHFTKLIPQDSKKTKLEEGENAVSQHEKGITRSLEPVEDEFAASGFVHIALVAHTGPYSTTLFIILFPTHSFRFCIFIFIFFRYLRWYLLVMMLMLMSTTRPAYWGRCCSCR